MTSVSVVIPVFNRSDTIRRSIDSALAQKLSTNSLALEVLVVDDGSNDDLSDVLATYGDRVKIIRHDRNLGAAAARNTGVANARGDYVGFLDSDDIWLSGKLEAQIDVMRTNRWRASCTSCYLLRPQQKKIVSPRYRTHGLVLSDLVWGCFVSPGSTLVFEREIFDEVGPLDIDFRRLEDWDWLLRFAKTHELGFLAKPLANVELSPNVHSSRVLAAIERLKEKHLAVLAPRDALKFQAALEIERAAVHFRTGDYMSFLAALFHSLRLVPIGNAALSAVLHNRLPL